MNPIAIGLGSNLGPSLETLQAAVGQIVSTPGLQLMGQSHWYETLPVGPPQPNYINGCLVLLTHIEPEQVLHRLLDIERQFGRQREVRWGPRTLDLDLLIYGQTIMETAVLNLPHPRLHERAFVLVPLAELWPDGIHPILNCSISQLVQTVDCTGVKRLS
ncbi:MAG: 2-amino-4-hydroxy-6-hydroxymethyldihydropteridine diphosphokinase [Thermosynechococcaceae cyanobacterium]